MMRTALLLACLAGAAVAQPRRQADPDGGVPTSVTGRVVDETGAGVANVVVTLTDTTRLSGYVDALGCGTYYRQHDAVTDADGRFSAALSFRPNRAVVEKRGWLRFPSEIAIDARRPILITASVTPHRTWTGTVVDAEGKPVAQARVGPLNGSFTRTDAEGRYTLEIEDPQPAEFRVRRIGFKPLMVPTKEADTVVLKERRALLTVTVLDPATKQPVSSPFVQVAAFIGAERQGFCTAGRPEETSEPTMGTCVLDADPGLVTLRIDNVEVQTVRVTTAPQALTVTAPARAPVTGNPY
ncbi:MAG: hypothetical protein GQE15_26910 [Archangiaceae bacterium]|nr:hypothetical protein [Archangiaceae bacterium]